jgi:hypothetical protein
MIRIKPEPENQFFCPECAEKAELKEIVMQSIFVLADCLCEKCGFEFYQTLPVGHTIINTLRIGKVNANSHPSDIQKTWLTEALLKAVTCISHEVIEIKKTVHKKHDQVVILNTLDYLYGHALLKLYNAAFHLDHHKDSGLIIIVQKSLEWLVPVGCAEVWVVDLKFSELTYGHSYVRAFLSKEFERFKTIYVSKGYSHPDFTSIDIARFTRVNAFDLENFSQFQPTFTFVLREDRWWFSSIFDYWFYRICRKLGALKIGSHLLSLRQNELVRKTIALIKSKLPDANFNIIGLGTTGNFSDYAEDERMNVVNDLVEHDWCKIYAKSHVVIGVHGSNMLLPTAHAAGCVEILPEDRYGNMVQDISVKYTDRKQLYFYRFADQYSSPKKVANKAISIIENFAVFETNMCSNIYSEEKPHSEFANKRDDIYAIH